MEFGGGAGARVPVPAGAEHTGQQPRPEPIDAPRTGRYTLTPLFVPYSPAGTSSQHPGCKSTAGARRCSMALGPPEHPRAEPRPPVTGTSARSSAGLWPPGTEAAAAPMSYTLVWSEKAPRCLFIAEGWTRGSAAQAVPVPRSLSCRLSAHCPCPQSLAPLQQPQLSISPGAAHPRGRGG